MNDSTQDTKTPNMFKQSNPTATKPVSNGEAINNVEIIDMSPKPADIEMDTFLRLQKKFDEMINANEIRLSAKVVNKLVNKGKERTDKATGMPILDEFGQVRCYPDRYVVSLSFQGGSLDYGCDETMFNDLELGSTCLFKGRMGFIKDFGKEVISPIFTSYTKVF